MPENGVDEGSAEQEPLLASGKPVPHYVESGGSAVGPISNGIERHTESNGAVKTTQPEEDPEGQQPGEAREAQFKGMPEVRKQMKFILPALSIGVWRFSFSWWLVAIDCDRYGSPLQTKPLLLLLMGRWEVTSIP